MVKSLAFYKEYMEESVNKEMAALIAPNIRTLVNQVNEKGILKEDIVSLLPIGDRQFALLYYCSPSSGTTFKPWTEPSMTRYLSSSVSTASL